MKTLQLYLTRQVLLSLIMTVAVFTFVLLLGNALKQIIPLLVSRQITLGLVGKAIALMIPYVMAYVLPFAMLTAVLLVFGRFSADQELTAVRASGISLASLLPPILLLSLLFCGVCALFNLWIAPQCRGAYKSLLFQLDTRSLGTLITEDRFITEIPGMILYIRKKDGDKLEDIRLYDLEDNQIKARTTAKSGGVIYDEAAQTIGFKLFEGIIEYRREKEFDLELDPEFTGPLPPPDPTAWQQGQWAQSEIGPIGLSELLKKERKPKLSEMTFLELQQEKRLLEMQGVSVGPIRIQMHRQIAFSFACFAFTLIAVPLAIQAHRRETSIGIALALILVMVYYSFLIVGEALEAKEHLHPHLLLWLPNFLFEALGALLLYRANKN
jgi:lipopolysaccharide export system permease protein